MSAVKKTKNRLEFKPDYAVAPGETLAELIESLDMSQKHLALRTGLTEQSIVRILKGDQPITFETANRLELVTGVPARMWNKLETQYREQLSKIEQQKQLKNSLDWLKEIPIRELIERGAIPDETNKIMLLHETLKFYGVSSVKAWRDVWSNPKVAARRSDCFETLIGPASAWIRLGELQAQQLTCAPFDKQKFEEAIQSIRALTVESQDVFVKQMCGLCAEAGVALALVPEIKKVPWNGASKWLSSKKAMILLNLRGKGEDIFWFSFFHEAYHVLHGKKQRLYIANKNSSDPEELKADRFAAKTLIPDSYNPQITAITTKKEVKDLALNLGISPGIVAGRYRHLTKQWTHFKNLTRSLSWIEGSK